MTKFNAPEQLVAAGKAQLDQLQSSAEAAIARSERLAALNLETARAVLAEGAANSKALLDAKDPQELIKLQSALAQPMVDKAVAYARGAYQIASEGQSEASKLFETQVAELNQSLASALEQAQKSAPAGSEPAFEAAKSMMAAANNAYDAMSKAAKQAAETAEASIAAATDAAVKAVGGK